ncbi:MAG: adenosine deaminase, partial [Candidatus Dormiibacterota bacterium]
MTLQLAPDTATRRRLAAIARGDEPADAVLRGGALVDVYTDEILDGWGVAIGGDRVASLGPDVDHLIGERTRVIELDGWLVAPGLVEGHTHLV